jgi:hypothetical protein
MKQGTTSSPSFPSHSVERSAPYTHSTIYPIRCIGFKHDRYSRVCPELYLPAGDWKRAISTSRTLERVTVCLVEV